MIKVLSSYEVSIRDKKYTLIDAPGISSLADWSESKKLLIENERNHGIHVCILVYGKILSISDFI